MENKTTEYYEPTMKVYDQVLNMKKIGIQPKFKDISRDDLYILYVVEGKYVNEIAELYNTTQEEVIRVRKKYGIMAIDAIWYGEDGKKMMEKVFEAMEIQEAYYTNIVSFEECLYDILEYMSDSEPHLLREFWQFTNNKRIFIEREKAKNAKDGYIKAIFCLRFFVIKKLAEETDNLEYKITPLSQKLLDECKHRDINFLTVKTINKLLSEFKNIRVVKSANKVIEQVDFEDIKIKQIKEKNNKSTLSKRDFEKINKLKKAIGDEAEELVYKMEKERLEREGEFNLKPIHESKKNGDGEGFDIKSFIKINGKYEPIYIEVKATDKAISEPFDITANEVEASRKYKEKYYIYRIGKIHSDFPKMYQVSGSIEENFNLMPTSYKAQKK